MNDTKGRVNSVGETIAGSNFSTSFTFDSYGRLSTRTHPSGIVETLGYNSYGYMATISAGGSTRYTLTSMNAREQLTGATYGSNLTSAFGINMYGYPNSTITGSIQDYRYSFDTETGNLNSRLNSLRNKTEWFTYDNLDRLTGVSGPQNLAMTFNANGNLSTKSDIGTTAFGYGASAGPYALTGVSSSTGVIPTTDQTATYTSFEKVSTLSEGVYSASFIYNSENQRAKMTVTQSGSTILTRWYAGGSYMKETASGVTKEYTYLGGDAYTAPVAAVTQSGTTTYYYLLRDYLGNITHQVNTSNVVVAEYNFDAWGRRRSADDWSYTLDGNDLALFADRGFTGHETLSWFNLVNMNGRLYDPLVGRFLSADPYVQMPDFTQNFNRYSYCLNNPLKFTDQDGEWIIEVLIFAAFTYLKTAHDNRNEETGKWAWNPLQWFKDDDFRMQAGVNINTDFSDVTVWGGAGFGDALPASSYNSNQGFGFGSVYGDGSNSFYYPSYNYYLPEQKVEEAIRNARDQGEFKQYDPSIFDNWSESNNFIGRLSYDLIDGVSVTAQSFFRGPNTQHLNGTEVTGSERTDAFVNTTATLVPMGNWSSNLPRGFGYTNRLNAAQFSKTFKGNLSTFSPSTRGFLNRGINWGINYYNKQISSGLLLFKSKGLKKNNE